MTVGYYDYGEFLRKHFDGKVQKIAIDAGFKCPNRDGKKGTGGCIYCNNHSFNPAYCQTRISVSEQIERGKEFFARKYPTMRYLAYFQAYTNTYADIDNLKSLYEEALSHDGVVGLIIATRPDCVSDELLCYLSELAKRVFVMIEYGVETSHDRTLRFINRGHLWADVVDAVQRTAQHKVMCGAHLILGLPGETVDDFIVTAERISQLPLSTVKLHQLQVIRGTRLAEMYVNGEVALIEWSADEYIDVCLQVLQHLRSDLAVERFVSQSPGDLLIFPRWGLKNYEFTHRLNNRLKQAGIVQGKLFKG
ncbi:MAG: TIGR01212 family radical SAM protein [Muribaculaceae bacterium]